MPRVRKHYYVSISAAISVLCAAYIACGYFASLGAVVTISNGAYSGAYSIRAEEGLIRAGREFSYLSPAGKKLTFNWTEVSFLRPSHVYWWNFNFKEARRSSGLGIPFGPDIEFPIWCAWIPCLIMPLVFLLRRKRDQTREGFTVVTADN